MARSILDVITAIRAVLPTGEYLSLRSRLVTLRASCFHTAPEDMGIRWKSLEFILENELATADDSLKNHIREIISDTDFVHRAVMFRASQDAQLREVANNLGLTPEELLLRFIQEGLARAEQTNQASSAT